MAWRCVHQRVSHGLLPSFRYGQLARGGDGSLIYRSPANNVSIVVNQEGRVITMGYGVVKPR